MADEDRSLSNYLKAESDLRKLAMSFNLVPRKHILSDDVLSLKSMLNDIEVVTGFPDCILKQDLLEKLNEAINGIELTSTKHLRLVGVVKDQEAQIENLSSEVDKLKSELSMVSTEVSTEWASRFTEAVKYLSFARGLFLELSKSRLIRWFVLSETSLSEIRRFLIHTSKFVK